MLTYGFESGFIQNKLAIKSILLFNLSIKPFEEYRYNLDDLYKFKPKEKKVK